MKKKRERRAVILLALEGKNKTEKMYFSKFNSVQQKYHVNFVPGNFTDPDNMARALEHEIKNSGFDASLGDKAFCVFDLDADLDKIRLSEKLVEDSRKQEYDCVISNPCFEVWYICHFKYSTKWFKDGDAAIDELKHDISNYSKTMDVFATLDPNCDTAIGNAKRLEKFHIEHKRQRCENDTNPYTEVYRVVELMKS